VNKVYDGTTGASVTLSDDRIAGDLLTDSYTSASFTDKNVGNGKAVIVNGISIFGAESGNYALQNTSANTTADINARTLTITATGVTRFTMAPRRRLSICLIIVSQVTFSSIRMSAATFIDRNVGTGKVVSVSGISISGADAGNYTLNTTASTSAGISVRHIAVTGTTIARLMTGTSVPVPHLRLLTACWRRATLVISARRLTQNKPEQGKRSHPQGVRGEIVPVVTEWKSPYSCCQRSRRSPLPAGVERFPVPACFVSKRLAEITSVARRQHAVSNRRCGTGTEVPVISLAIGGFPSPRCGRTEMPALVEAVVLSV